MHQYVGEKPLRLIKFLLGGGLSVIVGLDALDQSVDACCDSCSWVDPPISSMRASRVMLYF